MLATRHDSQSTNNNPSNQTMEDLFSFSPPNNPPQQNPQNNRQPNNIPDGKFLFYKLN